MRIAYVGNFGPEWSTENDYRLAFEALGCEIICLQEDKATHSEIRRQALNADLLLWTGTWDDAQPLDESLTTFYLCAREGIPTATVHLDTFWPVNRDGRKWWLHPMFRTAHVFTADGDWPGAWEEIGINHHWLPPAVRHTVVQEEFEVRPEFECDVAFVGSDGRGYHPEWHYRTWLVDALEEMCKRNRWLFLNPGGRTAKVPRELMGDFYASARVTVGDSLCPKENKAKYWSDRVYEATGRSGLLVMPQIDALDEQFDGQMPTYPWGDWDALEKIIRHYLLHPLDSEEVRSYCYEITKQGHTYVNRAQQILRTVGL